MHIPLAPWNVPAGHTDAQLPMPGEPVPAVVCPAGHAEQSVAPDPENDPMAQGMQTPLVPAFENVPAEQEVHAEPTALPIPFGHRVHEVDAPAAAVIPAGHA